MSGDCEVTRCWTLTCATRSASVENEAWQLPHRQLSGWIIVVGESWGSGAELDVIFREGYAAREKGDAFPGECCEEYGSPFIFTAPGVNEGLGWCAFGSVGFCEFRLIDP